MEPGTLAPGMGIAFSGPLRPSTRRESFREEAFMTITHSVLPVSFGPLGQLARGKVRRRACWAVSMVAIMHETDPLPSPGPGLVLPSGDLLTAVGTNEALDTAAEMPRHG